MRRGRDADERDNTSRTRVVNEHAVDIGLEAIAQEAGIALVDLFERADRGCPASPNAWVVIGGGVSMSRQDALRFDR